MVEARKVRYGYRMKRRQGQSILSALMLTTLLLMSLVLLETSTFQSPSQEGSSGMEGAQRLAETAVRLAMARILRDPTVTSAALPEWDIELPAYAGGHGLLALDSGRAQEWGIPLSINNLGGRGRIPGWDTAPVNSGTACLVGVGRYRGVEQRLEVVLHVPRFPYVLASSLPVQAIDQGNACLSGSIRLDSEAAPLPQVDIASLDPVAGTECNPLTAGTLNAPVLHGMYRAQRDLRIERGLTLRQGVLYVDGSLNIRGGLTGNGAIVATGAVSVEGSSGPPKGNQIAILSGGSMVFQGLPRRRAQLRGLLYAQGSLQCRHADIVGVVVVNSRRTHGQTLLEQVQLREDSSMASIQVPLSATSTWSFDLDGYLSLADRVRLLSWKRI